MLVIANPHGGGGRARERVRALLREWPAGASDRAVDGRAASDTQASGRPPTVRWTAAPGDAERFAAEADAPVVVAAGGDGTTHEVVQGLMTHAPERRPALGLLPAGSGNSLARDLGLLDPARAHHALRRHAPEPLDLARLEGADGTRYAFNIAGWALTAEIGLLAESLRWLGPRRYDLAGALAITRHRPRRAVIEVDDARHEGRWSLVYVANTQHTGAGLRLIPEASTCDGLLDVLLVPARSRWRLLRDLRRVRGGKPFADHDVVRVRAARVRVEPGESLASNVDGEIVAPPPWTLSVVPGALRVLT